MARFDGELAELEAWLRLASCPGVGPVAARRLLAAFGSPVVVFQQSIAAWQPCVGPRVAQALACVPQGLPALLDRTCAWLADAGDRQLLPLGHPLYPALLLQSPDPPLLLYARGQVLELARLGPAIAVVGSRQPTPQGAQTARQFGRALAQAGWCVVSGLAQGIDAQAHRGALEGGAVAAEGMGPVTLAVVGTGLDRDYPSSHAELACAIAARGVLLSEYPLGTPPRPAHFPRRNRLIAGLSHGTLVVEAALQSGSLITARLAAELGREVMAIPGSIHSVQARGCHALIRQGAKLVESVQDVVEELPSRAQLLPAAALLVARDEAPATLSSADRTAAPREHSSGSEESGSSGDAAALLQALGHDPVTLEALAARTGWDTASLQVQLLNLELGGDLARLPGGLFQRIARA